MKSIHDLDYSNVAKRLFPKIFGEFKPGEWEKITDTDNKETKQMTLDDVDEQLLVEILTNAMLSEGGSVMKKPEQKIPRQKDKVQVSYVKEIEKCYRQLPPS